MQFFSEHLWLGKIIIAIIALIILDFLLKFIIVHFPKRITWKKHVEYIFFKPLKLFLWVIGISYVIDVLANKLGITSDAIYLDPIRKAAIVICVSWCLFRWKEIFHKHLMKKASGKKNIDKASIEVIGKLSSIAIIFISILIILPFFKVEIVSIVAFGGIGAAVIGFSAKDMISNFFGGLMLYINRPFIKDDLIKIPEKKILGFVDEIGWYMTKIIDLDKCPLYLPNSLFSTTFIENYTRRTHRRIEDTIGVRYKDFSKLQDVIQDIQSYLKENKDIDQSLKTIVAFRSFKDYSLEIFIRTYTFATGYGDYLKVKEKVLMEIKKIMAKHSVEIPFPTRTIEQN